MTDKELMQLALGALEWHLEKGAWGADIEGVTAALRERLVQPEQKHEYWCASLTQLLLSNPPKPASCDCKTKLTEPE